PRPVRREPAGGVCDGLAVAASRPYGQAAPARSFGGRRPEQGGGVLGVGTARRDARGWLPGGRRDGRGDAEGGGAGPVAERGGRSSGAVGAGAGGPGRPAVDLLGGGRLRGGVADPVLADGAAHLPGGGAD